MCICGPDSIKLFPDRLAEQLPAYNRHHRGKCTTEKEKKNELMKDKNAEKDTENKF
jgi:hypothetical protein